MSRVNVLAVLDAEIKRVRGNTAFQPNPAQQTAIDDLRAARAAVAELIEASDDVAKYGLGTASAERLRDALARVQGGAQ